MTPEPLLAVLRQIAAHPVRDRVVLRGGVVSAALLHPVPRVPDDVDLLVVAGHPLADVVEELIVALAPLGDVTQEPLWPDSLFPGRRLTVGGVQVDVGAGDPVAGTFELHGLRAVDRVTSVSWKVHGLFERADGWRPKDLHDVWLLLREPIPDDVLRDAVATAFATRDAPLALVRRLLDGKMGRSPESRKSWRRHLADHPERPSPSADVVEVVSLVADALRPVVAPLLAAEPAPDLFPALDGALDEVRALVSATPGFREIQWDDHVVFTYEGARDFPDPDRAVSHRERRRRQLLRELRGLGFDPDGRVVARKLHKFFGLNPDAPPREGPAEAVEKLDGSLIAAQRTAAGLRLVTRRGPSSIADAAQDHAAAAMGAIGAWVDEGLTPLFEWCTPDHVIVLGHDAPRLVLVALRHRDTGRYVALDEVELRARDAGLPSPARLGVVDPAAFLADVRDWRDREGVIFVWPDGERAKGKAQLYRWCHHLVEGPDPDRALWWLVLEGELGAARAAAARRGLDVEPRLAACVALLDERARRLVAAVDPAMDRKALALSTEGLPGHERRLRFRVHSGEDAAAVVRDAARLLLREGRDPSAVLGG